MNKTLIFLGTLFCFSALFGQTSIDDARSNFAIGQTVTIKGVAADDGEFGPIRYIQDATGGIPAYGAAINGVNRGDSVIVTGELKDFNGLLEVDPISNVTNEGPGVQIAPWNISIPNMGETFEGRLVQFDDVTFPDAGGTFAASTNYDFTDGTNTGQLRITPDCGLVGQAIPAGAQSLVGLMSQYISNYQVLPRDVNDIFAYSPPARKIEVEVDGSVFLNNETAYLGTTVSTPIVLKNLGVNNLTISSATITGTNAGDFSTDITAVAIAGSNQTNNTITFTSGGTGSRQAVLEIVSDDPDNPNFIINLYAIGNDNLATEPTSSPAALQFSNVNPYTMSVSFDAATDAEQYLVVWKEGSAPTSDPVDGTEYLRGDVVGDGQVAFVGAGNSFTPRGIIANTDYYFSIYAFNGYGQYVNYNQTGVLAGNESSTGEEIGTYYNGISSQNSTLIDDLTALINPHTFNSYFQYKSQIMDQFEVKDTVNGESYVVCAYSGERKVFPGLFDWQTVGYSREHTYAHSWMPTFPADNPDEEEYVDYHNLYPTNLAEANSPRSNLPFDVITGSEVFNYLEGSVGYRGNGDLVYEPREAQKGNLARAIFYMATCYNGANGTGDDWSIPSNQYQEVLKNWHFGDLPDNYEIARHELIYDLQDNRNPYIDSVDFACYVDFSSMSYDANAAGCELSVTQEDIENNLVVFPNPSSDVIYVQVNGMKVEEVNVIDMMGRSVQSFTSDKNAVEVNVASIPSGSYFIKVVTKAGSTTRKIIVK